MGVLRQFGALLWKNYILRKRKPIFLLLEVLWPVIIFVVIALIRRGVPPSPSDSCSYQERALPSAGMVPFLQSAACTLDNHCYRPDEVAERSSAQERLRSVLYKVEPIIRKNTTITAFEVLPTLAKVFNTLKVKLNDSVIKKIDNRLVLKNLVRDEEKIIQLLVDKHKLMSGKQARALMDASLNPLELLKTLGKIDFKAIACNDDILVKHIVFQKNADVTAISQSLCAIEDHLISNITNEIVRQLDVANLIRIAEDFANYAGEFDYAVLLSDIAELMDVYLEKSGMLAAITDLPDLTLIPAVLDKLSVIIPVMEKLKTIDMESISALYEVFEPLLETVVDQTTLDAIRQTFKSLKTWSMPSAASEMDWMSMFNMSKSLTETFNALTNSSMDDIISALNYADFENVYQYITSLMSNSTVDPAVTNKIMEGQYVAFERMMRDMMNETTMNMMMAVSYEAVEALAGVMNFYQGMDREFRYFVSEEYESGYLMDAFLTMGPWHTSSFLKEVVKLPNFKKLMRQEVDANSLCVDVSNTLFGPEEKETYDVVMSSLCSVEVTSKLDNLIRDSGYDVMVENMENSMQEISHMMENPKSVVTTVNMKTLNDKITKMTNDSVYVDIESKNEWNEIKWSRIWDKMPPETTAEDWWWAWKNVSDELSMANTLMAVQVVGESMEDTKMWNMLAPAFIGSEAYLVSASEPYRLLQDVRDENTPVGMIVKNMEYLPDILPAMMTFMNSDTGQKVMEGFYADPMKSICEEDFLLLLNVSEKVPVDDIEKMICDTDWETFQMSIMDAFNWVTKMGEKLNLFYKEGTVTVDWDKMTENAYIYMTYSANPEQMFKDLDYSFSQMNITKLLESLGAMNPQMQDMSFTDMKRSVASIVPMMEELDKSLASMPFWNYAKHVAKAWTAYTNIANDAMEHFKGSSVNLEEYMNMLSPTLGEFYTNMSSKFPTLFEEISKSLQNPQKVLPGLLNVKWEDICKGTKISEILQIKKSEGVTEFENGLCELNWTAVMEEIVAYNPNMQIYQDELIILSGPIDKAPAVAVNWTELVEESIVFMENLQAAFQSESLQIEGIDVDRLNMTLGDFVKTLTQTDPLDMTRYAAIMDEMMKLLKSQDGDGDGNATMWDAMLQSSMLQAYIQYHSLVFTNKQLHYFNTTNPIDIKKYLNSEEANKIIRMTEVSSQVNAALLDNVKQYLTDPKKMTELLSSNFASICEDKYLFAKLFTVPADLNLTIIDLQDTVCGVNLDTDKLVYELEQSISGLIEFRNALSILVNMTDARSDLHVNITLLVSENERFTKLIEDIIRNPPNITVFWSDPEEDMKLLLDQLKEFSDYTAAGFGENQLATTFGTLQQHLGEALSAVVSSSPEVASVLHIADAYLQTIENSLLRDQKGLWEDPHISLADYPEMLKVWELMEMIPDVFETFQYTLAFSSDKLPTFMSAVGEGFDKLCSADPETLMTVPPNSNFKFDDFMTKLCDINITTLNKESNSYSGGQLIMDAYANLDNITEPTNVTELFTRLDKLYQTIVDMGNTTTPEMKLPRFLDAQVWEKIFASSADVFINSSMATTDESITAQIIYSIDQVQTTVPEIRPFLHIVNEYMAVTERSMQFNIDIMRDPANAFMDYPEMRKMWLLLDYLPEVYETYQYTSLIAPDKMANFTAAMTFGIENLCAADPSHLMTVPPKLDFDFADFHQKFCAINMTKLSEESMDFSGSGNLTQMFMSFSNLTDVVNLNEMANRIDKLTKSFEELFNVTTGTGSQLPRFLNFTLWMEVMESVNNRLMDPAIYSKYMSLSAQQIFMPFLKKEMEMAGAVVEVFMDAVIDRLQDFSGEITKEYLLNNNTELMVLLDALNALIHTGLDDLNNGNINISKVISLVVEPTKLQQACKDGTFITLITKSGNMSNTARSFEKLMCMDIEAVYKALMDLSDTQSTQEKIMRIFNFSEATPLDWNALNSKTETLIKLITEKLAMTPTMSVELTELLDLTKTLPLLNSLLINPAFLGQMTTAFQPLVDQSMLNFMDPLIGGLSDLFKTLAEKNVTIQSLMSNPDMLGELLASLNSFDEYMATYSRNFLKPAIEHASTIDEVQQSVCDNTVLETASKTVPSMGVPIDKVVDAICGQNGSEWYTRLIEAGLTQTDLVGVKNMLESFFTDTPGQTVNGSWSNLISSMSELVNGYKQFFNTSSSAEKGPTSASPFDENNFVNNTMRSVISMLMIMETELNMEESLNEMKQFFSTVIKVQKYIDQQLEKAKDGDMKINLEKLLPDAESLANMLTAAQGEQRDAIFTLMAIYPEQFLKVSLDDLSWDKVACDPYRFYKEFKKIDEFDLEPVRLHLCDAAKSNNSVLSLLLNYMDMGELIQEISTSMSSKNTTRDVWNELWQHSEKFMKNIMDLQNVDTSALTPYVETLLKYMDTNSLPTAASYVTFCENTVMQFSNAENYAEMVLPILNMIDQMTQVSYSSMQLGNDMLDVMCVEPASNMARLVELLKMSSIPEKMKSIGEMITKPNSDLTFSCERLTNTSMRMLDTVNQTFISLDRNGACIEDQLHMMIGILGDVTKLFEASKVMLTEVVQDENFQEFMKTLSGNDETVQIMEYFLQGFVQQQSWIEEANENIKNNITDIESYLQDTFSLSPNAVESLLNATFNKDLANSSAAEVVNALCTDTLSKPADDFLSYFNSSLREVFGIDCNTDWNMTYDIVNSLIMLSRLTAKLDKNIALNSIDWWMGLSRDISELVSGIQGLTDLTGVLDTFNSINITNLAENGDLLNTLQRLLVDNGPDSLIDSLNKVLDRFGQLNNDSQVVFQDIKILTRGLLSFTTLRRLFIGNMQIKDFLKDPDEFQLYLIDNVEIPEEVARALVDGSLSFELLINASQEMNSDWICKPAALKDLLKANGKPLDYNFLSETFCDLDRSTLISVLDEVFKQLDIGELIEEFLTASVDEILAESGTTLNETQEALDALQTANDDLQEAMELFSDYAANMTNVISVLAQAQIGTASPSTLSALLCGREVDAMNDDFYLSGSLPSVDPSSLTAEQRRERAELKALSPVCERLYLDIMGAPGGPIIWSYLKPIIRGKILFSPYNEVTKTVVRKINSTFAMIEDFQKDIQRAASGASSFSNITSGDSGLESLFSSPLVIGFLSQLDDSSGTGFEDMMYTLNNTDPELTKAMSNAVSFMGDYIQCIDLNRFVGYDTEEDLEWEAAQLSRTNDLLAGVVFTNTEQTNTRKKRQASDDFPSHVMYKIRMAVDNVMNTRRIKDRFWRPDANDQFALDLRYFRGFIQLQDFIDSAVIESITGSDGTKIVALTKQFPFPCHKRDTFLNALIAYLLPVMMTFAWLAGLALATYNLVLDREDGQEENLRAMGLVCCLNWWAWFLCTMFMMAVVSVIVTIITHYANLVPFTDFSIIFLYFVDFCFSATMMCYFVSSFFTRTSIAILVTLVVYFLSYLPYVVLLTLEIQMEFWQKTLACLSSTSAFGFAAQYLARYEEQQIGMQWSNIQSSPIPGDEVSFSWCCIMMLIDGVIYLVLGWYVRNVKPGKYGVSEPWYFPICPNYWFGCFGPSSSSGDKYQTAERGEQFEAETSMTPKLISVRGLSKEYKKGKPVVSDLDMDVHAGQVTTLLGHNGAAKTTTMNMLTGVLEPTSGHVSVFNRPVGSMRESIGICPQHNALYKYMTVKEHMEFVQSVKSSYSSSSPKEEIRQILEEVNLWYCRHSSIHELSGGMQRRLCVALAFVGGSKAIILDEPTSGVDPSGRRSIWNLIIRKKSAIGVLLSTHHLDEAEVISDKVCILHEGRLLCSGSPLYLKEKFSSGHRITVEKDASASEHSGVTMCVQHFVPGAVLQSSMGNEITYVLPASNREQFHNLFKTLEEKKEELHITSFGVSDPTLEEVFLTVCRRADNSSMKGQSNFEEEPKPDFEGTTQSLASSTTPLTDVRYKTGFSWKMAQFFALIVKRFHHYRRNWRLFLSAILLPVLLFLASSGLYTVRPDFTQKNLLLSPAIYGPNSYFFIKDQASHGAAAVYGTFMENPGIGTTCMENMEGHRQEYKLSCVEPATEFHGPDFTYNPNATCSCHDYKYSCDKGSPNPPPKQRVTSTDDILQNLEGRNIEGYLFESFDEFIEKRYGGFSFEEEVVEGSTDQIKATVWFNNKGYHSLPSFYSGLSNGILRSRVHMMNKDPVDYGITTFNHPFTFNNQQLSKDTILQSAADLGIAMTIMLAFTFIPVGIVMYSVVEYINKEKHLQFISGIGPSLYWITSFFWDLIVLMVTTALVFAVMAIFQHDSFWARNNAAGVVVLILLYGWATLPLVYCTTKIFNAASTAFLTMFCVLNFIGLVPMCILFLLNFYQHEPEVGKAYIVCQKVFLVSPTFALGQGLIDMMTNQLQTNIFSRFGTEVYVDPFTFELIGWNYVALGIEGFVFFILAILLDVFSYCNCESTLDLETDHYEDDDVAQERQRLYQQRNLEDSLVGKNISKVYKRAGSRFLAVDHLTFGVSRGQCFGLLGVNGAGKTTTFKILTGSLEATGGTVYFSEKGNQKSTKLWQNIGYCPQEEALDSFLTIGEMLEFYGKMRGLDNDTRKMAVRNVIENLELQPICNKTVRTCSGGMKRKLSLAIALLGEPSFILLDEPTTGMDPVAKRLAWNCIKSAKSKGQTIVLTSHSMEECDVLCSRISILVNGQMKCLGSPQHLKNKYGDTYTIMLHVCGPSARSGKIFELVQSYFPGASIRDHHLDVIQLDIPKQAATVSEIFRVLEKEKEHYNILYYTVSQNTLETVFLNFAREQHDTETEGSSDRDSDLTMPIDDDSKLSSKQLPHMGYGYMNKAYDGVGEIPYSPSSKIADPYYFTMETDSSYSTNL